jgi:hypothetical protein
VQVSFQAPLCLVGGRDDAPAGLDELGSAGLRSDRGGYQRGELADALLGVQR